MRIVVIGAGVLGASTAWHLAREGAEVIVVDQAHQGRATAAGAGILCPWVSDAGDPVFYALYAAGARYYAQLIPALAEVGEADLGFRRSGALVVSTDTADLAFIEAILQRRRSTTPEMGAVARLSAREARELFPPLGEEFAAVHVAGGARVDGRRLAAALLRAAQHCGAVLREGHAELVANGDRIAGVRLEGKTITADQVVLTAGAWAPALLRPFGIDLPIVPQRGQIIHLGLSGVDTRAWPVVLPPASHYLLAFDDSRVVVGATRESGAGFDYRVTAAGQHEVLSEALGVAPGLATATIIETRVGFRPAAPGIRPLLGRAEAIEGLVIGNGLGAAGLTIGPFAGRMLADVVFGRRPALDLAPFDPLRRYDAERHEGPPLR
ncbi:MAG TPA: FAD-dependent oxidoreductase [Acetobacteraceae bacterium]|nr:FAD-dependent oxidoreductase [Acetobacteraceae bacterium]